jgi:MFS family permease
VRISVVTNHALIDRSDLSAWIEPRADLVIESLALTDGRESSEESAEQFVFSAVNGPFDHWRRVVTVTPPPSDSELVSVTETIEHRLAVPVWHGLFTVPIRRHLRRPPGMRSAHPWWAPPDALSPRAATVLSLLCVFALVGGYLGTLITQTLTYAAADFGATTADQGTLLAGVRVGVLLSLVIVATADRRGRRSILTFALIAGCSVTAFGALAPGMVALGATQTFARAFSTVVALVIAIIAVEEMPAGARAFAVSVVTLTAGLGAGLCVLNLLYIDLAVWAWRIAYLLPLLFVPVCWRLLRRMPETFRFEIHERSLRDAELASGDSPISNPSAPKVRARIDRRRFALLASGAFCWSIFIAPAAQFLNEFLRTERGFSGAGIALFVLATNTPGGIGIVLGGRLAERHGRRVIGALGITGGVTFTVVAYLSWGWPLWLASVIAAVVGALAVPALAVYGPELFPTESRGRANGGLQVVGVAGSSAGLLCAGWLADHVGGLGQPIRPHVVIDDESECVGQLGKETFGSSPIGDNLCQGSRELIL